MRAHKNWESGQTRTPNVYAVFGNGREFNISLTPDFHKQALDVANYDFGGNLPTIGQGLICLNKTSLDLPYNMHLGAVLAEDGKNKILISNMMEALGIKVELKTIEAIEVSEVSDFLEDNFAESSASYSLGLLMTK